MKRLYAGWYQSVSQEWMIIAVFMILLNVFRVFVGSNQPFYWTADDVQRLLAE